VQHQPEDQPERQEDADGERDVRDDLAPLGEALQAEDDGERSGNDGGGAAARGSAATNLGRSTLSWSTRAGYVPSRRAPRRPADAGVVATSTGRA
jgi:hypothetical protein